ncbi:MAG TPA: DMT family transporter [Gaiellaceae bacterium]|nr:DMT family transporter [Gaiellaceae bacterium]
MRRYWSLLLLLAAVWGASYLLIKLAVEEISPAATMAFRVAVAALLLVPYAARLYGVRGLVVRLREAWRPCAVLGLNNAALPFWLVAWGETHVDSSIAAIAQSSVPIFNLLIALRVLPHERVAPSRALGLAAGLAGVALVTGLHPQGGLHAVVGTLAVVLASVSYASAGVYGQLRVRGTPGPILATGSMLAAALYLLPFGLAQLPAQAPGWRAWTGLLALTVLGTALAQIVLFRILAGWGSARLSLVTYLMPGFAVVYGAFVLDEPVSASALAGLGLILLGVAFASGGVPRPRRERTAAAAEG